MQTIRRQAELEIAKFERLNKRMEQLVFAHKIAMFLMFVSVFTWIYLIFDEVSCG